MTTRGVLGGLTRRTFLNGAVAAGCAGCVESPSTLGSGSQGTQADGTGTDTAADGGPSGGGVDAESRGGSESGTTAESDGAGNGRADLPLSILFITADDMGWKSLENHGAIEHCPNLNALAIRSRVFTSAFNVTSSCSSSRASFGTGQYPSQHGVTGLVHRHPEVSLPPKSSTLARILQSNGYVTGIGGKFHMSDVDPAASFGYSEVGPNTLKDNDFTAKFIEDHAEVPFFLELNYKQTHRIGTPRRFPMDEDFPVSARDVIVPAYWALPDIAEIRESLAGYLSRLCKMDHLIGGVLDLLDQHGLREHTMVLFVSDNGVSFPGNKTTLYDRGTGSPCILFDPRTDNTAVETAMVSSIDYAPTLLEAAGLHDPTLAGAPLTLPLPDRDAVFSEIFFHKDEVGIRAIRTKAWKFIANTSLEPIGSGEVSDAWEQELAHRPWAEPRVPFELYDLAADPHEQTNLVDRAPTVAAELYDQLLVHTQTTDDDSLPSWPPNE